MPFGSAWRQTAPAACAAAVQTPGNRYRGDMGVPTPPENAHAVPPVLVAILFATMAGSLGPGAIITLTSGPGNHGSPLNGLLLPWSIAPFFVAVTAGWRARYHPRCRNLAIATVVAAAGGTIAYLYGLLLHPDGAQNIQLFKWVPAVQLLLILRLALRAWQSVPPQDPD